MSHRGRRSRRSVNKKKKRPEFNYFVALQINDQEILENFENFLTQYFKKFPESKLKEGQCLLSKSHFTLQMIYIPEGCESEGVETFKKIASSHVEEFQNVDLTLFDVEIMNTSAGNRVVYADADTNGHKYKIKRLRQDLHDAFRKKEGFVSEARDLHLHCTLINTRDIEDVRQLENDEYKHLKGLQGPIFGTQKVKCVQLLKRNGEEKDGYYQIVSEVHWKDRD